MTEQLYLQLIPQFEQIEKTRIQYLFFKKFAAVCIVMVFLLFICLIVFQTIFAGSNIVYYLRWWMNNYPYSYPVLILIAFLSYIRARELYRVISSAQQDIFSVITKAVCPDFQDITRTLSIPELIDTRFFNDKNNKPLYIINKGAIRGKINGAHCELWDINVLTNKYQRLMMIPVIGTIFGLLSVFIKVLQSLSKKQNDLSGQGFKGLLIKIDFDRPLYSWTVVLPNTWEQKISFINKIIQRLNNNKESDVVHLVDVNFADKFTVYSPDQVEARYILTPTFMEMIFKWQEQLKRPLFLSFNEQCVYIAIIDDEGIFEIPLAHSALNPENIKKPFNDLTIFTKMIEDFKADKGIWHKTI